METIANRSVNFAWIVGALSLSLSFESSGGETQLKAVQDVPSEQVPIPLRSSERALLLERQAMMGERMQLLLSGATPEMIAEWRGKNAARFAAQQRQVIELAGKQTPMHPLFNDVKIPAGSSMAMEKLLEKRDALHNDRAQLHIQMSQGTPEERRDALNAAQQRAPGALKALEEAVRQVSDESKTGRRIPVFPAPDIPAGFTSELRAVLADLGNLRKERGEMLERLGAATSGNLRKTIVAEWQASRSTRLKNIQEATSKLATEKSTP